MSADITPSERKPRPPIPLYHQLYVSLREKIVRGEWQRGDLVPSEQEISTIFNVSRVTVRRALDLLEKEDLLRRFQGRGSFVSAKVDGRPVTATLAGQLDNAVILGRQTSVRLLDFSYIPASAEVQRKLLCEPRAIVQWSARIRVLNADATPVSYVTTYVPERIGRTFSEKDLLSSKPVLSLIERSTEIGHAEQMISATLVDEKMSALLNIPIGAPLLEVQRVVLGPSEEGLMFSRAFYNPDRYEYRMSLKRPHASGGKSPPNIYD